MRSQQHVVGLTKRCSSKQLVYVNPASVVCMEQTGILMCKVRRCNPIVLNHTNRLTDNSGYCS